MSDLCGIFFIVIPKAWFLYNHQHHLDRLGLLKLYSGNQDDYMKTLLMRRSRSGIQSEQSRKPGFRCRCSNIFLSVLFQILVTKIAVVLLLSTECPTSNMDPKTFWIRSCVTGNFYSETLGTLRSNDADDNENVKKKNNWFN